LAEGALASGSSAITSISRYTFFGTDRYLRYAQRDGDGSTRRSYPCAVVELDNADQGIRLTTKTGSNGGFSQVALRPGRYLLLASHAGFDATVVRNITLSANDNVALQVMLKVAGNRESITVNDRPSLINLSPAVSNTIDHELVASYRWTAGAFSRSSLLAQASSLLLCLVREEIPVSSA